MADLPLKELVRTRIRSLRLERGLTQEALCERAEVSVDAVNRIENGTRVPTIDTLEKIALALGVSTTELLQKPPHRPVKAAAAIRRVVALLEGEPEAMQEGVEEVVRSVLKLARSGRPKKRS